MDLHCLWYDRNSLLLVMGIPRPDEVRQLYILTFPSLSVDNTRSLSPSDTGSFSCCTPLKTHTVRIACILPTLGDMSKVFQGLQLLIPSTTRYNSTRLDLSTVNPIDQNATVFRKVSYRSLESGYGRRRVEVCQICRGVRLTPNTLRDSTDNIAPLNVERQVNGFHGSLSRHSDFGSHPTVVTNMSQEQRSKTLTPTVEHPC